MPATAVPWRSTIPRLLDVVHESQEEVDLLHGVACERRGQGEGRRFAAAAGVHGRVLFERKKQTTQDGRVHSQHLQLEKAGHQLVCSQQYIGPLSGSAGKLTWECTGSDTESRRISASASPRSSSLPM